MARFDAAYRLSVLAEASGLEPTVIHDRLWASGFIDRVDAGEYTQEGEFAWARDTLGLTCDYEVYRSMWCSAFSLDAEVLAIAADVRQGAEIAILTNNGPILADAFQHELRSVGERFDHVFLSYQFGATKPIEAVYRGVEHGLARAPGELLLIDDSAANVEAACRFGWMGLQFESTEQLAADLHACGLLGPRLG